MASYAYVGINCANLVLQKSPSTMWTKKCHSSPSLTTVRPGPMAVRQGARIVTVRRSMKKDLIGNLKLVRSKLARQSQELVTLGTGHH